MRRRVTWFRIQQCVINVTRTWSFNTRTNNEQYCYFCSYHLYGYISWIGRVDGKLAFSARERIFGAWRVRAAAQQLARRERGAFSRFRAASENRSDLGGSRRPWHYCTNSRAGRGERSGGPLPSLFRHVVARIAQKWVTSDNVSGPAAALS